MTDKLKFPIMTVGRYAGTQIDKLPNSYLRWMITQDFPKEFLECARRKLEESEYNNLHLNVSRHAIDAFSKRFLDIWLNSESKKGNDGIGLASFVAMLAQEAWDNGTNVSKHRHQDDGITKEWKGIKWVFGVNPAYPEYQDVITVMHATDQE